MIAGYYPATRWASYGKRFMSTNGPCPAIECKSFDTCEGRMSVWDESLIPSGYTGSVWAVSAPTGWSGDRWNKKYELASVTGCLSLTGETGPRGSYDVFWRVDMSGITGVAHGQYYGVQVMVDGWTGIHHTADLVIKVKDYLK